MINHSEMVRALVKDGGDIIADLTPETACNLHMVVGISGEVAELLEAIADGDNVLQKLGDVEFFFEGLQQSVHINIEDTHVNLEFNRWNLPPLLGALSIQAGHILDTVKKQAIYAKELNLKLLQDQMLDFRAILSEIYKHRQISYTPRIAKEANVEKLSVRYKGLKYSNKAAQERADKK